MTNKNSDTAEAYYRAVHHKDLNGINQYIHPEIQFTSPFAKIRGKEAFLEAVQAYFPLFKSICIYTTCGTEDKVMLAYDVECAEPVGTYRTAVLMHFKEGLISELEIIFDTKVLERK